MPSLTKKLTQSSRMLIFPAITKVSWQRFKRAWPLLTVIWLAMAMLLTLACIEPLFARATTFIQLQRIAQNTRGGATFVNAASIRQPTPLQMQQLATEFSQKVHAQLGNYLEKGDVVALQTPALQIFPPNGQQAVTSQSSGKPGAASSGPQAGAPEGANVLTLTGYDLPQVTSKLKIVKGRLPDATANSLEIAISAKTALDLELQIGSLIKVRYPVSAGSALWQLRVVGLIEIQPAAGDFWHSAINNPGADILHGSHGDGDLLYDGTVNYHALTAQQPLLSEAAKISSTEEFPGFIMVWQYTLDLNRLNADTISDFLEHYRTLINGSIVQGASIAGVNTIWITEAGFVAGLFDLQSSILNKQIIALLLLCLTIGLALLMTGTISHVLVEHQMGTVAIMRSRGASRGNVFWAFATQGIFLVLLALCVGPLLALGLIQFLLTHLLPTADQSALDFFIHDLTRVWLEVRWLVLVAGILALATILRAIYRATSIDILTLRQETARTTQRPFWRRYHLDIILAIVTCIGYSLYIYSFFSPLSRNGRLQLIQTLISLIAVPFILMAVLLLCLRMMPWLFHLTAKIISRIGSVTALLAFAQMERAPRTSSRLILLLVVSLASSLYLLNMADTQYQRYPAQTNFQVGADFKGSINPADRDKPHTQLTQVYRSIKGVRSVTLGYTSLITAPTSLPDMGAQATAITCDAVDSDTYASTAIWSSDYSQQSPTDLMQQLKAHRTAANTRNVVYAIVDAYTWKTFALSPGADFFLPQPGYAGNKTMHFVALARINNIPGIYSDPDMDFSDVGLLVDYQNYATVYAKDNPGKTTRPDTVWLRTADDATSLGNIRHALPDLLDRRALLDATKADPSRVNIMGIFGIGIGVALGLALLSTLIVSWVNITSRRASFAALRALGMAPRQIAAILIWEHGSIYTIALLLSLGIGWLFSFNVAPAFKFISSLIYENGTFINANTPSLHTSFPLLTAALLFGTLFAIIGVALIIMALVASRPVLNQVLRLNED